MIKYSPDLDTSLLYGVCKSEGVSDIAPSKAGKLWQKFYKVIPTSFPLKIFLLILILKGGGYPADNPYFTSGRFDESHVLGFFSNSGKVTELRIRRSGDGSIRVSGRVHTSAGFQIYNNVNYETGGRARANVPCTNGVTIFVNSCTTNEVEFLPSRGGNVLYLKSYKLNQAIYNKEYKIQSVIIPTTEGYTVCPININLSGAGTFDFTIKDAYIYEGAYLNPPYNFSIDSNYSNPGFLKAFDRGNQFYKINKAENVAHWFRIAKLAGNGLVRGFEQNQQSAYSIWKGYVVRPWLHIDVVVICSIEARILWSRSDSLRKKCMYIGGNRLVVNSQRSGDWLKKWRIAYNYEKATDVSEIYLETYMNKSNSAEGNPILVYPEFGLLQRVYDTSIPIVSNIQQGSYDVIGDNDTMLGTEYTITDVGEDFTV